jgi:hypothetical protein
MRIIYTLCALLVGVLAFAQKAEIRGFIYNKKTGEPVQFANIFLKETYQGVNTDENGLYVLTKITPGTYNLVAKALGYDSFAVVITLDPGKIFTKNILMEETGISLNEVNVSAERQKKKKDVYISVTNITAKELKMIPSIGGEPDLVQFLQVLPGVVFSGDQGGQLYIRGGSPVMNKVLLDGMTLYNPFHSIGLFSVFDSDILKNTEVYSAGFGAEYGGRISAIVDVKTRDGDKNKVKGKVNLNTFTSKIMLEGPLKKFNPEDGSSTTFIASYKNSFLNKSSKIFYNYIGADKLPYSFEDMYGKVSFNSSSGSKINFFAFKNKDKADFKNASTYQWASKGFGSKFYLLPQGSSTLINATFTWSNYDMTLSESDAKPRNSNINGFFCRHEFY